MCGILYLFYTIKRNFSIYNKLPVQTGYSVGKSMSCRVIKLNM